MSTTNLALSTPCDRHIKKKRRLSLPPRMTEKSRESHIQHNNEYSKKLEMDIGETTHEQRYAHRDSNYQIDFPKPKNHIDITHDKTSVYQMDLQHIHTIRKK